MDAVAQRKAVTNQFKRYQGKLTYGNSWDGKFFPATSGFSDCSGTGFAAYRDGAGVTVGKMSYDQATDGALIGQGTTVAEFGALVKAGKLREADIIAMDLNYSAYTGRVNHVEYYSGSGLYSYGHGGPGKGPNLHLVTDRWLLGSARKWYVRRVIADDTTNTTSKPLDDLEEVIAHMKATHVIFTYKNGIGIWNVLAGTFELFRNPTQFKKRLEVLGRTGAKVVEWKHFTDKKTSSEVEDPSFFGINITK